MDDWINKICPITQWKTIQPFFFCTGVLTQGLHLQAFHHPFFVMAFFKIGFQELVCLGWLQTVILLISASGVARIIGDRHGPGKHSALKRRKRRETGCGIGLQSHHVRGRGRRIESSRTP
jgi:hypothetical protein